MSPLRIERKYVDDRGVNHHDVEAANYEFVVGPADAAKILGIPRTTLFRHDGLDIDRMDAGNGPRRIQRVYTDRALLRIALEVGRADISRDTGMIQLEAKGCKTLLNIPHSELSVL